MTDSTIRAATVCVRVCTVTYTHACCLLHTCSHPDSLAAVESRGLIGRVPCNGHFDWLSGWLPPCQLREHICMCLCDECVCHGGSKQPMTIFTPIYVSFCSLFPFVFVFLMKSFWPVFTFFSPTSFFLCDYHHRAVVLCLGFDRSDQFDLPKKVLQIQVHTRQESLL